MYFKIFYKNNYAVVIGFSGTLICFNFTPFFPTSMMPTVYGTNVMCLLLKRQCQPQFELQFQLHRLLDLHRGARVG